jgi:erythronate-4-phosphate dehydrogenase
VKILVDENIPAAELAFAQFGQVERFPGRSLSGDSGRARLQDVDALIVRSVTRVDETLLADTAVRFVGSATIGFDHIDLAYLQQRNIAFATAPGSNADSVVDYVLSAICAADGVLESLLDGGCVGIIGLGNVGGRLAKRLLAMGVQCIAYDPLLPQTGILRPLAEVLRCNVLCLHTPLTNSGPHSTFHLLDLADLQQLPEQAMLINAGRGEVLATEALLALVDARPDIRLALDVWEPEPGLPLPLLERCLLGTPHIAGYSADGKLRGTAMIAQALATSQGLEFDETQLASALPEPPECRIESASLAAMLRQAVLSIYNIAEDDQRLRAAMAAAATQAERDAAFDWQRKHYPTRREYSVCQWYYPEGLADGAISLLSAAQGR